MKTAFLSLCSACVLASAAAAQSWAWDDGTVPFVVSPLEVVDRMLRLAEPRLVQDRKPGGRVVSDEYERGGWRPDGTIELTVAEKMVGPTGRSRVHLWFIPADARGTWKSEVREHGGAWQFRIEQVYQRLDVAAHAGGVEIPVRGTRLRGDEVKLVASGNVEGKPWNHLFRGTLKGDRIEGELLVSDGENNRTYPWTALRAR